MNNDRAEMSDIRRPKASDRAPKIGVVTDLAIIKPVPHQKAFSLVPPRARVMAGREDDRIVAFTVAENGTRNKVIRARRSRREDTLSVSEGLVDMLRQETERRR